MSDPGPEAALGQVCPGRGHPLVYTHMEAQAMGAERPGQGPGGLCWPQAAAEAEWSHMDHSSLREEDKGSFRRRTGNSNVIYVVQWTNLVTSG